jgi:hypothetical protein
MCCKLIKSKGWSCGHNSSPLRHWPITGGRQWRTHSAQYGSNVPSKPNAERIHKPKRQLQQPGT